VILGIWTLSVLRFTFTFVNSKDADKNAKKDIEKIHQKTTEFVTNFNKDIQNVQQTTEEAIEDMQDFLGGCDVAQLLIDISIQDVPFLAVRLTTVGVLASIPNETLFFLAKNALIIAINIYRVVAIKCKRSKKR